jgi:acetyl-CoA C-acetyltransferase
MPSSSNTPVLVGVGQIVSHWDGEGPALAPDPISLCVAAARNAMIDTGNPEGIASALDTVVVVRTNQDSVAGIKAPFGRCANPPMTVASDLRIHPKRAIYSLVGGDQPQALVNEFAEEIFDGRAQMVLLTGGEAIAAMKRATRKRFKFDWSRTASGEMEDRGLGKPLLSTYELTNGLGYPTQTYPIFEQSLRTRLGLDRAAYRTLMAELFALFSSVAAQNPYAQFPIARDVEFLSTPSADNYEIAEPYLKWHVAQDAVNQGAAVILTSVAKAQSLGIDESKWVYLHGYAHAADRFVTERSDLSRSRAIELTLVRALESAGRETRQISHFDLYSCFPCAVLIAAEALGLDWRKTTPTVTGGLPFFGGPGNNYSMHAIASMVERLRSDRDAYGLVLANGGFLSKEAAGVYSAQAPTRWKPVSSSDLQAAIDSAPAPALVNESTDAVIESFTVTYARDAPERGYILGRNEKGRILARARSGHRATLTALAKNDPIGKTACITHREKANYLDAVGRIGEKSNGFLTRQFTFIELKRDGHVLEITLNRPESLNSLHTAAHFELHEIWDAFEADNDLWVAIITGAGDRAFSSGNDLKATAKGADMSQPSSGFAGLCSRFDREKPIVAAVNGIAMGGGMEIALACDLVVADERAKFALPEVKVGLFAAAGGVQRLSRQIGRKAAMEMILTGRHITAAEAKELGIVNSVVPAGTALTEARKLARTLQESSPSSIRASKQALNELDRAENLKGAMEANGPIFGRLMRTRDFREGVMAFAEKRKPEWSNS